MGTQVRFLCTYLIFKTITMKLFKKDSKGKLRFLEILAIGSTLHQNSGIVGGKVVTNSSVCTGKNIGRANETTPEEQAVLEANSKYIDKLTKGYFQTPQGAENTEVYLPMLAKDAKKEMHKIVFPCFVQPKLDGMRALGNIDGLTSRAGKPIDTLKHIVKDLSNVGDLLDGELYAHGKSFQENMTIIKKYRKGLTEEVKYHVYDMAIPNLNFKSRYALLTQLAPTFKEVELVPTFEVQNMEEVKKYHSHFLSEGYEGTIIRWGDEEYKFNGRSSHLLKYKDFIDITAEVVDIIPMDKRPEQGKAVCKFADGTTFTASFKMSFAEREEILVNKSVYIGQTAEIRFFEYFDDGVTPRFPVCVGFRLDK